jgi:hypothetical protein
VKSRLHVYYQPVRPPTWSTKHEGIHARSSNICCKRKDQASSAPKEVLGSVGHPQAALHARILKTAFAESVSHSGRDLRQAVEGPLCGPLGVPVPW